MIALLRALTGLSILSAIIWTGGAVSGGMTTPLGWVPGIVAVSALFACLTWALACAVAARLLRRLDEVNAKLDLVLGVRGPAKRRIEPAL